MNINRDKLSQNAWSKPTYINSTEEIEQDYVSVQRIPSNIITVLPYRPDTNSRKLYNLV